MVAAKSPITQAMAALTAAVRSPMRMLMDNPVTVRTNISRPMKSVPNGYARDGGRFFLEKSVTKACCSKA